MCRMEQARRARRIDGAWIAALVLLLWGLALPGSATAADGQKTLRLVRPGHDARVRAKADAFPSLDSERQQELLEARMRNEVMLRQQLGPHGVSRKGLAARDRRAELRAKGAIAEPETLRILLVRIGFETDRSGSLTSITEDGDFVLEPDPSVLFDPPPHDANYFQAHLEGLAEYWGSMSAGLLTIESRVLPPGRTDSYKLSDIADYGPGSGGFWSIDSLERLVQDMITLADEQTQADGSANLSDYDFDDPNTYIIFAHAGGDIQSNLSFTPGDPDYSPNDIPTFFVTLGDEAQVTLTSTDSETGEPGRMTECSVIPESTNQDGLSGSIAAALYHEFGHALGLPDLYSTFTGLPTVGYWDIMDTGTNLTAGVLVEVAPDSLEAIGVTGLLPPQTSIWCKWFLGFADEIRVGAQPQAVEIASTHRQNTLEKALRIDVSPDEFFLVSNRWIPPVGQASWGLVSDDETGVVQYLGRFDENDQLVGNTHMYDFFLPWGGGVMIWRVRQDRVEENLAFNTVQALPENLGVELIEADGIQDIGVFEFTTRGFVGSDNDPFRARTDFTVDLGNGPETITYPGTATEFGAETFPPSRSTLRVDSGVEVEGIGEANATSAMLQARVDGLLALGASNVPADFPLEVPDDGGVVVRGDATSLTFFPFDTGDAFVFAAQASDGSNVPGLYAVAPEGTPRFATERFLDLTAPLSGPPIAVEDFRGEGPALLTLSVDGVITAQRSAVDGGTGLPLQFFNATLSDSVDAPPVVVRGTSGQFIVGAHVAANRISVCDSMGTVHPEWESNFDLGTITMRTAPVAAKVAAGAAPTAIAFASRRGLELRRPSGEPILDTGDEWVRFPEGMRFGEEEFGWTVAWPQEEDGPDRFVVVSEAGRCVLVEPDGQGHWTSRFFGGRLDDTPVAEPSVGDLDGDGRSEVVIVTPRRVWARNLSGVDAYGFPVNVDDLYLLREQDGDRYVSSAVIADLDGNGLNDVLVQTDYGLLHGIGPDGVTLDGFPQTRAGRQAVAPLVVDLEDGANLRRAVLLFDALGDSLSSGRRTRPARLTAVDLGVRPADDPATRPAEWLGRGGGSARGGRGRTGAASTVTSLVAAIESQKPLVYPNPMRGENGDTVYVRFYSGTRHTAKVTVYTLEGEEVLSSESEVQADTPEELQWSARGLASGPYLCKLEYTGPKGPSTDLMTLYIER